MNFEEEVIKTIESNIEKEIKITPQTDFEELELDSFGMLILVDAFEQTFNVSVQSEEFIHIRKVSEIIEKLEKRKDQ
jgi:acyl carrier protein